MLRPARMFAALLFAAALAQSPAAGKRVVLLPLDSTGAGARSAAADALAARGVQVVPRQAALAPIRAAAQGDPAWQAAEKLRQEGLQAEQNLDLAGARKALSAARDGLAKLGAPFLDTAGYASLLAALARVEDEQGDGAAADATLHAWAALPVPALNERAYPPRLVARAARARAQVSPRPAAPPLRWLWKNAALDAAVTLQAAGPRGGALTLLWYPRGASVPLRTATVPWPASADGRARALSQAAADLAPRPRPPTRPKVPSTPSALVLGAGFIFPSFEGYTRVSQDTVGVGLGLYGRYEGSRGPAFGGRIDLSWGAIDLKQATVTARWTLARGPWRFSVEPGVGFQVRQSFGTINPSGTTTGTTDLALVLGAGGYVGLRTGVVQLEEGITLGVDVLATSYEMNLPAALHTRLGFVF